jgi:hypothetical protein
VQGVTRQNQPTNEDAINILEELARLVVLDAEEHGVIMAEHSQALMEHIEKVLIDARQAMSEEE